MAKMDIRLKEITIRELTENFVDNAEEGVKGYNNRLDIRPPYQREFIYNDKQRDAVIDTIVYEFPLNVMYWALRDDGTYEIIDGQQRTLSICKYVNDTFPHMVRYFRNLKDDEKEQILNYKLTVYICSGTDSQKLAWFKTINIAGVKLTDQELRNAVYSGSWVTDAKKYFSKDGCPAFKIANKYLTGTAKRQEYFETAIAWEAGGSSAGVIEGYMATHQHDKNALTLWNKFQSIITWVDGTFTKYRPPMKGVDWGTLYTKYYKDNVYDTAEIEAETTKLMLDDDVTKKSGIYPYILTRDQNYLSLRAFTPAQKIAVYEKQKGICPLCGKHFIIDEMEGDHITPWIEGGKTQPDNLQMVCKECNRRKGKK
jgi:hypothetical protein